MPMNLGLGLGLTNRAASGSAPSPALILDALTAGAAYSTRLNRTAYGVSSPCMRVRENGGNTLADVPFKLYAFRDHPYWLDEDALLAHCGSNSGFVETWYDQSGNARHVTQATTADQPRIVNAGVIETLNGLPAINFHKNNSPARLSNASPFMYAAGSVTMCVVTDFTTAGQSVGNANFIREEGSPATYTFNSGNGALGRMLVVGRNDANTTFINFSTIGDGFLNGVAKVLNFRDNGSQIIGLVNGVQVGGTVSNPRTGVLTLTSFTIGPGTLGAMGRIAEALFFAPFLTNANMNTVNSSQGEAYGISVSPFLTPVEQLAAINGTGDGGNSLALNLDSINDFNEVIYIDRALQARGWQRPNFSGTPAENLDADEALASLPAGDTTQQFFFNSHAVDYSGQWSGRFRLTFTGSASNVNLASAGTNVAQITANTYEFDCDYVGNKWIVFTPTSFPIKVSIVKTSDLAAHASGQIFRDQFLNFIQEGSTLRFMNAMLTNNSTVTSWDDHNRLTRQNWRRMPYAAMVSLCNDRMVNPWVCIPHLASDDYVTTAAEYLRDNLDPNLLIRVELSNEIWNTGLFSQGAYFKALAESEWGVPDGFASGIWLDRAGKRFAQIMQIFNAVFARQTHRICGVLAGQAGNVSLASRILDAPQWQTSEPGAYVAPRTLAKEWSIAPYIGWVGNTTTTGNAIKAALDISQADAVAAIKGLIPASLSQSQGLIDAHVPVASLRGLRLTMYEYNNHYDLANSGIAASALYSGGNPVAGALDAFIEATYSQEMADAQDDLRAYFRSQNSSLMTLYKATGLASRFGTWGGVQFIGQTPLPATWDALVAWHSANGRWWSQ